MRRIGNAANARWMDVESIPDQADIVAESGPGKGSLDDPLARLAGTLPLCRERDPVAAPQRGRWDDIE